MPFRKVLETRDQDPQAFLNQELLFINADLLTPDKLEVSHLHIFEKINCSKAKMQPDETRLLCSEVTGNTANMEEMLLIQLPLTRSTITQVR